MEERRRERRVSLFRNADVAESLIRFVSERTSALRVGDSVADLVQAGQRDR
jgi:hypothetical protein